MNDEFLKKFPKDLFFFNKDRTFYGNPHAFLEIVGYTLEELQNKNVFRKVHWEDIPIVKKALDGVWNQNKITKFQCRIQKKDKAYVWVSWTCIPFLESKLVGCVIDNISPQKEIEKNYISQKQIYKTIFDHSLFGIITTDHLGNILEINGAGKKIFSNELHSESNLLNILKKKKIFDQYKIPIYIPHEHSEQFFQEIQNKEIIVGFYQDSEIRWVEVISNPIPLAGYGHSIAIVDITKRKLAEEKANYLSYFDATTGLPNFNSLKDRFPLLAENTDRTDSFLAVLILDIDNFMYFNDSKGQAVGDVFLKEIGERLKDSIRNIDSIFRLGGDEYCILLTNLTEPKHATLACDSIKDGLQKGFDHENFHQVFTASIGVSIYPSDSKNLDELMSFADAAMHNAKDSGKNTYVYYSKSIQEQIINRLEIEAELRSAIRRDELFLMFQPQIDIQKNRIRGFEALVRWYHPTKGILNPIKFIPIAEDSGLIVPLGEWVLRSAFKAKKYLEQRGFLDLVMSINLSPAQFNHDSLLDTIKSLLLKHDINSSSIEIEITESTLSSQPEKAKFLLEEISHLGIKIAVDDFGTGYSSLGYLSKFPLDSIKIDKSFIDEIENSSDTKKIVEAIIKLAKTLGLETVAEGVETLGQLKILALYLTEYIQGYHFSKPMILFDAEEFLNSFQPGQELVPVNNS